MTAFSLDYQSPRSLDRHLARGPLIVTVGMALAVALWSHRLFDLPLELSFLFTLPVVLCFGFILWRPDIALPLALFALPLVNIHFELGLPDKTLSFDKLMLFGLTAGWILRKIFLRQWLLPRDPILSLWWIWLAVQCMTVLMTRNHIGNQLWYLAEQLSYAIFFIICLDVFRDRNAMHSALQAIVASGWAVALLGMAQRAIQIPFGKDLFLLTYPSTGKWETEFGSTIGHPNFYSAFQIFSIPLTFWALRESRGIWRGFFLCMLVVQCSSVFVARSIGGVVGLAVAAVVGCWCTGRRSWWVLGPVFAAVGVVVVLWVVQVRDPVGLDRSILTRTHILRVSRHIFLERPFFGHGLGSFTRIFPNYELVYGRERLVGELGKWRDFPRSVSSHNWFLRLIIEGGIASLLTFLGIIGWVVAARWYSLRSLPLASPPADEGLPPSTGEGLETQAAYTPNNKRSLHLALATISVGFVVQAFTDELFAYSKIALIFWALTAVGVILDIQSREPDGHWIHPAEDD